MSSWIKYYTPCVDTRFFWVCLPYAGGTAHIYREWPAKLNKDAAILAVQLPGHGDRLKEKPYNSMEVLVGELTQELFPIIKDKPWGIFGHSLGALISYQLILKLHKCKKMSLPKFFVASGCRAPFKKYIFDISAANFSQFKSVLKQIGGIPQAILEDEKILKFYAPLLKADFKLAEYVSKKKRLNNIKALILIGMDDEIVPLEDAKAWEKCFSFPTFHFFKGKHFFIHHHEEQIIKLLNNLETKG